MFSIYLAGHINSESYKWRNSWSNKLSKLGYKIFNPELFKTDYTNQHDIDTTLVILDKEAIKNCNLVLVNLTHISVGTSMEIMWAHTNKVPVLVVSTDKKSINIWHKFHCEIVPNFTQACKVIKDHNDYYEYKSTRKIMEKY